MLKTALNPCKPPFRSLFGGHHQPARKGGQRRPSPLRLEALEDRLTPAGFDPQNLVVSSDALSEYATSGTLVQQSLIPYPGWDTANDVAATGAAQHDSTDEDTALTFNVLVGGDDNGASAVIDPGTRDTFTATAGSAGGYLQAGWLGKGWLTIAISLDDCTAEVFLSADQVIVDDFDQCCREEKLLHRLVQQGRFSPALVAATLGEVVAGIKPLSNRPETTTYVNPMGLAVEDLAVALAVYRAAVGQGVGQFLQPTVA
jgi:hypothetical protein